MRQIGPRLSQLPPRLTDEFAPTAHLKHRLSSLLSARSELHFVWLMVAGAAMRQRQRRKVKESAD